MLRDYSTAFAILKNFHPLTFVTPAILVAYRHHIDAVWDTVTDDYLEDHVTSPMVITAYFTPDLFSVFVEGETETIELVLYLSATGEEWVYKNATGEKISRSPELEDLFHLGEEVIRDAVPHFVNPTASPLAEIARVHKVLPATDIIAETFLADSVAPIMGEIVAVHDAV